MIRIFQIQILLMLFQNIALAQNHPPQPITRFLISAIPYDNDSLIVPARYFDNGSYDLETPAGSLRFSYSTDPDDTIRIFTCANSEPQVLLNVYVFDEEDAYEYNSSLIALSTQYCGYQSQNKTDTQSPVIFLIEKVLPTPPNPNINICLKAEDFVVYGYDNGDPGNTLVHFSFSENIDDTTRCYSCLDKGYYIYDIYASDTVGNQIHSTTTLDVKANAGCFVDLLDTIPPMALCNSDTIFSIDSNGQVTIFPESLNGGSYDDKTEEKNLEFSFSGLETDSLLFTCDDLGDHMVSLIVTDKAGNTSACMDNIVITDPENHCNTSATENLLPAYLYKLYPNPSTGFYIQRNSGQSSENFSIKIIDSSGRIVYESNKSYTEDYIFPNVVSGMYMVFILSESGSPGRFKWMRFEQ